MRADARRNRRRLLDAAIELVLERGGEPTRDAVAERAGVGIGTLYRHFPDQQTLFRAVVLDVLDRTIAAGEEALEDSDDPLRSYLHAAVDNGLGVVNILHPLLDSTDWPDRTTAARDLLDRLLATARDAGAVGDGASAADITYAAIRFSRPLSIGLSPAEERAIAHRQVDTYVDGLAGPGEVARSPVPTRT